MNIIYRHKKRRKAYVPPNIEIQEFASEGALMLASGEVTVPDVPGEGGNEEAKQSFLFNYYWDDDIDDEYDDDYDY